MKISSKLMIIVILTTFEISLTLWSVFEISKGATLHQLNLFHLKYNVEFSERVHNLQNGADIDILALKENINNIRAQPVKCLEQANVLTVLIMRQIDTYYALELCAQGIKDTEVALAAVDSFALNQITKQALIDQLKESASIFTQNSATFEKPITKTVAFVMSTMIPLVIFISFFNITFITYMSRNITGSIKGVIRLLTKEDNQQDLASEIDKNVSGELKTLLDVAKERLSKELLITEVNGKLENLVKERTLSLTRANDELSQFAYRASHDLKAPLTSTKMLAKFIADDIENNQLSRAIEDANQINEQMVKLEELVTGILSLTEVDCLEGSAELVDFKEIVDEVKLSVHQLLQTNNCIFQANIDIVQPMKVERVRIKQIFENLVTNAIKYSCTEQEQSFVNIDIAENTSDYVIKVEDNGLGIPDNRKPELFEMFKRFHPNISFGSGLGMSIIKKHIDFLKGSINVDSNNTGTTFTIIFPKQERL